VDEGRDVSSNGTHRHVSALRNLDDIISTIASASARSIECDLESTDCPADSLRKLLASGPFCCPVTGGTCRNRRKSIPANHHRRRAPIIRDCSFVRTHIASRFYTHVTRAVFARANVRRLKRPKQIFVFAADSARVVSRHESISDQLSFGRVGTYRRLVNL